LNIDNINVSSTLKPNDIIVEDDNKSINSLIDPYYINVLIRSSKYIIEDCIKFDDNITLLEFQKYIENKYKETIYKFDCIKYNKK
jgi:hypothetical protein